MAVWSFALRFRAVWEPSPMAKLSFFFFLTVFSVAVASSLPINFDFN